MKLKGFGLIEMLVVVAIIAIMLSMLIPALSKLGKRDGKINIPTDEVTARHIGHGIDRIDYQGKTYLLFYQQAVIEHTPLVEKKQP